MTNPILVRLATELKREAAALGEMAYDAGAAAVKKGAAAATTAYKTGRVLNELDKTLVESTTNAVMNTVMHPLATAEALKDAYDDPKRTKASMLREGQGKPDKRAARAHQVVTARQLLKKGKEESPEYLALPENVRKQVEEEPERQGRRKDIEADFQKDLAEWQAKEGDKGPAPKQPLVVRLAIGGSGDAAWRTHCDIAGILTDQDLKKTKQVTGDEDTVYYTHGSGTREYEWNFAGPGGPDTDSAIPGGLSDTGPNSIRNLVKNAGSVVQKAVADALKNEKTKDRPIVILIKGHSRGAVAAGHIANNLKKAFPNAKVELTQVDPVPGPAQESANQKIDVGAIDQSTIVYGVYSGHGVSFTPQQVLGAKRIIISQQKHGVGIQNGFIFKKRLYTGNSLNSLPPGVYRDQNPDISKPGELERIADLKEVPKTFVAVYSRRYPSERAAEGKSGQNFDAQRKDNIEAVLKRYVDDVENLPKKSWGEFFMDMVLMLDTG